MPTGPVAEPDLGASLNNASKSSVTQAMWASVRPTLTDNDPVDAGDTAVAPARTIPQSWLVYIGRGGDEE